LGLLRAVLIAGAFAGACNRPPGVVVPGTKDAQAPADGGDGSVGDASVSVADFDLYATPLVFAPTPSGFGLNVALHRGDPALLRARVRGADAGKEWTDVGPPAVPAIDVAQWSVTGLDSGLRYQYEIRAGDGTLASGSAVTARPPGSTFRFAVMADTHIPPRDPILLDQDDGTDGNTYQEDVLPGVSADVAAAQPDFLLNLGDLLDYHLFGFNDPPPDAAWSRRAYLNYRRVFGETLARTGHFQVIGNWDGENGCNTADEVQRSISQRLLYSPGPTPGTYPQGGSANQDYYAFTWGDALFVVLNVMTYTPTCHLLSGNPGVADDWTLGAAQLAWLERTLSQATSKWRFLFIHHTVGGNAGDPDNSAYGRGGGRAARVGEQSMVHDLMLRHGVQVFFYAHDHVFTDMVVDGIHYTLAGSAGAPWKFDASLTGYTEYWPDSGFGRVDVMPAEVLVTFIAAGGQELASYRVRSP
jgi:hypothetical protein